MTIHILIFTLTLFLSFHFGTCPLKNKKLHKKRSWFFYDKHNNIIPVFGRNNNLVRVCDKKQVYSRVYVFLALFWFIDPEGTINYYKYIINLVQLICMANKAVSIVYKYTVDRRIEIKNLTH